MARTSQGTRLLLAGLREAVRPNTPVDCSGSLGIGCRFSGQSSGRPSLFVGPTRDGATPRSHVFSIFGFPSNSAPLSPARLPYSSFPPGSLSGILGSTIKKLPNVRLLTHSSHVFPETWACRWGIALFSCFPGFNSLSRMTPLKPLLLC